MKPCLSKLGKCLVKITAWTTARWVKHVINMVAVVNAPLAKVFTAIASAFALLHDVVEKKLKKEALAESNTVEGEEDDEEKTDAGAENIQREGSKFEKLLKPPNR